MVSCRFSRTRATLVQAASSSAERSSRTGELPAHEHGHVEGLDEAQDPNVILEGEAVSIAEDIERGRGGKHPEPPAPRRR